MRFLGLDFGDKTVGVAVSDPEGRVALGLETLRREAPGALRANMRRLEGIIREYGVHTIVLGFPRGMNGGENERCRKTLLFKEKLSRNFKRIPVALWDERLSTAAVSRVSKELSAGRYAERVDEMAAVYILQGYLDAQNKRKGFEKMEDGKFTDYEDPQDESDFDDDVITMTDEYGNEVDYRVLASKEADGCLYLLAEDEPEDGGDSDVLLFKRVGDSGEEMVFELLDGEHAEFDKAFDLFKDEYDALEIEIEN